jgi:hypothetical protein
VDVGEGYRKWGVRCPQKHFCAPSVKVIWRLLLCLYRAHAAPRATVRVGHLTGLGDQRLELATNPVSRQIFHVCLAWRDLGFFCAPLRQSHLLRLRNLKCSPCRARPIPRGLHQRHPRVHPLLTPRARGLLEVKFSSAREHSLRICHNVCPMSLCSRVR